MKKLGYIFFALSLSFPNLVCAKIYIATTIKPIHSLIKLVTDNVESSNKHADKVQVDLLIDKNSSPHHYYLRPSDMNKLSRAHIVFYVSKDLEVFMSKFVNSKKSENKELIELAQEKGIKLLDQQEKIDGKKISVKIDPHLWMSPDNARRIIEIVAEVVSKRDPKNSQKYRHNAEKAIESINNMDNKLSYLMNEIKDEPFIVYHDAYQYFTKYYGLNLKAVLSSDDHHTPGAGTINKLSELVNREKIKCVFGESRNSSNFLKTAIGKKAKIGYLDAEWGVNHPQSHRKDSEAYIIMMQNIADNIYVCLKNSIINTIPNK